MSQDISNMSVTWNNGATVFDGIKLLVTDTAFQSGSKLLDVQSSHAGIVLDNTGTLDVSMDTHGLISLVAAPEGGARIQVTSGVATSPSPVLNLSAGWDQAVGDPMQAIWLNVTDTASPEASTLMQLLVGGIDQFIVYKSGVTQQAVLTVASLPAGVAGMRTMVSDANATTFNAVVAGGGANTVPVFFDGTNWRIG